MAFRRKHLGNLSRPCVDSFPVKCDALAEGALSTRRESHGRRPQAERVEKAREVTGHFHTRHCDCGCWLRSSTQGSTQGRIGMLTSGSQTSHLTALAIVASVFWPGTGSAQSPLGTLTGVVTDAAGTPLAGAFVQMNNAERRLHFMVITQAQGKYSINRLPAGKYVVQAIGGERQSDPSAAVDVTADRSASVNLSLTGARAPGLLPAWPGRQPGERGAEAETAPGAGPRLADGEGKAIIEAKCMYCHDAQRIVRSRGTQARWREVLRSMTLYA